MLSLNMRCDSKGRLMISVCISNPTLDDYRRTWVNAMVDTGSDTTILRQDIANRIRLTPINIIPINSVNSTSYCRVYLANVGFEFPRNPQLVEFRSIKVLGAPLPGGTECLIGRDILSRTSLKYNGRYSTFNISF